MSNLIKSAFEGLDITLTSQQIQQFDAYALLLKEWNHVMNLTAVDDYEGIVERHFIDSCALLAHIPITAQDRIIDIGTGAGFPGLPLAIVSQAQVTLLDALNKRIQFLQEVITKTGIENVIAIHGRAETYARDLSHRASYDYAFSRAVASLNVLIEYAIPYLKIGGKLIAYKSKLVHQEIEEADYALSALNCQVRAIIDCSVTDIPRYLVVIEKMESTPQKYPRRDGKPAKSPL